MEGYKPGDNEILEEVEVLAAMKKMCTIKFEAENGGLPEIRTRITGVYADGDAHFLKTESGMAIRLDKLLQIDDKPLRKNC